MTDYVIGEEQLEGIMDNVDSDKHYWKWNACKGCKFKKECDIVVTYLPPCGIDYDEELTNKHDAEIRKSVLNEVMNAINADDYYMGRRWKYQEIIKTMRGES